MPFESTTVENLGEIESLAPFNAWIEENANAETADVSKVAAFKETLLAAISRMLARRLHVEPSLKPINYRQLM